MNVGVLKEREDEAKALLASEKAKAAATLAAAVALQEQAIACDQQNIAVGRSPLPALGQYRGVGARGALDGFFLAHVMPGGRAGAQQAQAGQQNP